jgi:hypothetical protein
MRKSVCEGEKCEGGEMSGRKGGRVRVRGRVTVEESVMGKEI